MTTQRFTVTVGGADVAGVLHLPDERPAARVIAGQGMGASKDSEKYLCRGPGSRWPASTPRPRQVARPARDARRLYVIAGANHRLTDPGHRREGVEESRRWLSTHLPDRTSERIR